MPAVEFIDLTLESPEEGIVAKIVCSDCGTEYFYRPSRGKRSKNGKRNLQFSRDDLLRTLAELVECPKCGTIQQELIRGYRNSKFRFLDFLSWAMFYVGCVCCVFSIFAIISTSSSQDANFICFGIGFPLFFFGIAGIVRGFAWAMRRAFSLTTIEKGSNRLRKPIAPEPLFWNEKTERLEPAISSTNAISSKPRAKEVAEWIDCVLPGTEFPTFCIRCLAQPDPLSSYRIRISQSKFYKLPICRRCSRNIKLSSGILFFAILLTSVFAGHAIWQAYGMKDAFHFYVLFLVVAGNIGMLLGAKVTRAFVDAEKTIPDNSTNIDESEPDECRFEIRFRNVTYRELLHRQNSKIDSEIG